MTDRPELTEEMKQDGWLPFETAPDGKVVELLTVTASGGLRPRFGQWDAMEGQFYTHGELWPIVLEPIAWRPIQPFQWRRAWLFLALVAGVAALILSVYGLSV